jgi:hypothetical protein
LLPPSSEFVSGASGVLETTSLGVYGLDHFTIVLKACTRIGYRTVTRIAGSEVRTGVYIDLIVMDFIDWVMKVSKRSRAILSSHVLSGK